MIHLAATAQAEVHWLFTLKTNGDAINTHEMWVCSECTPAELFGYDWGDSRKAISRSWNFHRATSANSSFDVGRLALDIFFATPWAVRSF